MKKPDPLLLAARAVWMPRYKELETACASCPFGEGNDKEWAAKVKQLADKAGEENPADPRMARNRIKSELANAPSGDFICHGSAYDTEMDRRDMKQARQCPGASAYYRSGKQAPMDGYFAVFNQHLNNAGPRAKFLFIEKFGRDVWNQKMAKYEDGIMAIFDTPPTKWTQFYVDAVTTFVNEGRT